MKEAKLIKVRECYLDSLFKLENIQVLMEGIIYFLTIDLIILLVG